MPEQTFTTHKPTGTASYPIVLLAGVQGGGKSWAAAEATGLPYFKRSFWLELGEQMADEYGDVPGADYEIIEHDGSYRQVLAACKWAARESKKDGPGVFVLDSVTELWGMLSDEAQISANDRARRKAEQGRGRRLGADEEADISVDLWNVAKDRSNDVMEALRDFNGLVILTARLDDQAVIGAGGKPTGERIWKMRVQKEVPFYCQLIMQARSPRQWTMTKVASTKLSMPKEGTLDWQQFTIEEALIRMELDGDRAPATRNFTRTDPGAASEERGGDRPADDSPSADEPRGDLPPLPERKDLEIRVKHLEKKLARAELFQLFTLAKNHNNRIAMAVIESAGKRVARRLEAGETPPEPEATADGSEGDAPEPTAAEQDKAQRDAEAEQEAAQEAELQRIANEQGQADDAPKAEPSEDSSAAPESPTPTEEPSSNGSTPTATSQSDVEITAVEGTTGEDVGTIGGNALDADGNPVTVEPDDEAKRRDTPRRRATLTALTEKHGADQLADFVFGQYGLDPEYVSTSRLSELLKLK